ncbi:TetR/AcrR family transcriptional regulator [Nocardioides daeguensis]|uniref:TetR/AcrR family transcriptional regulator n=1 Tax=Nocardioides daeguensis TaxID=908359 RepID=A0ABP6WEH6_9ACTN|nr:TetR/AcrR family transcriptional regulator [Nocardioides daeguensis]MBV6728015.1 TetR/AcrR family transcriptional regulator [Nocardioides daeguensis]MCR1774089.1 TetR/AcrR family transcriptional regulator [Nocardioides daeguensis]
MSAPARKRRPYAPRVPMAERREQLLDAALTIIDRDGYDGVSIDAIAREVGVTRPVVYGAFDGLGPLLTALLDRQQQRAITQLYGALPLTALASTPLGIVERAVPALHAMVLADPVTWRAILRSPANVPDVVRERIEGDRTRVRGTLQMMVAAVLPGADAEVLAHAVLALLDHFGQLVLAEPEQFSAERLTAAARAMIGAWIP